GRTHREEAGGPRRGPAPGAGDRRPRLRRGPR
ncbi:MAG: hypothetical protein AVDCRST_MAG12-1264, partial [uncultured Rubrobacteraceae bacterium]